MTSAKPRRDHGGMKKVPHRSAAEWQALQSRVQAELRPFYPDKSAAADDTFAHPADAWANYLLNEASSALAEAKTRNRPTNEELRAELAALLKTLQRTMEGLDSLSLDLDLLLGPDVDALETRDAIATLLGRVESARPLIERLPKASRHSEVQHAAAVEMAARVIRVLEQDGMSTGATVNAHFGYQSDVVKILMILGDAIGLHLADTTWKGAIVKAKRTRPLTK